ncbi:MAG: sugar phosphate isomerase/epimerase [Actinobacteria bacterium]|nr:sugar phosphate isomerase/epimerase [Actinomycetota bacterium]
MIQEQGFAEIAFLDPELFLIAELKDIIMPFKKSNITVSSIHFAQFNLSKLDLFLKVFNKTTMIAGLLNCDLIVIHPSMGKHDEVKKFLNEKIEPVLEKEGLYLCWETFESRRRIFGGIDEMFKFCKNTRYHRICYDFSHIHKEQEKILEELKKNIDIIKIFHLSNRMQNSIKQHYPVYYTEEKMALDFDKILSFLGQIKFRGHLVLEYLPQFHSQLLLDGLRLKNLYEEK